MLKSKSASKEKKRKHAPTEEQDANRRRVCTESSVERSHRRTDTGPPHNTQDGSQQDSKDEMADAELDRIGSDMEEGGLDLSLPFQPISAYSSDRQEMLEQCFQVLGEKKLQKMLPEELKSCPLEEIKKLCWEQLEQLSQNNLRQILAGEELSSGDDDMGAEAMMTSQQDNNVDSTSSIKDPDKLEDPKQDGGEEENDVLSINADTCDSDIDGPKVEEEHGAKEPAHTAPDARGEEEEEEVEEEEPLAAVVMATDPPSPEGPGRPPAEEQLEEDIEKSVSEILASSGDAKDGPESNPRPMMTPAVAAAATASSVAAPGPLGGGVATPGVGPEVCQPSLQQLELLELEMRARAIKALMKASNGKRPS